MKRKSVLFLLLMAMFMPLAMHAQKALPYEYGFENQDLAAEGWTTSNLEEGSGILNLTDDEENPYYVFAFQFTENPPQFLISPQLTGTENGVFVEFDYASYAADYGAETFQLGYSTTTNATSSFTWYPEVTVTNELYYGDDFVLYSKVLPAGTKYVAVKCTSYDAWYLFLDNFSFTVPDPCAVPSNLVSSEVLVNSATLSWEGLQNTYNVRYRVPESMNYTFFEDFENGFDAQGWTTIRNGGGNEYTDWRVFDATQFSSGGVTNHSGDYVAISRSWSSSAYNVDNWLITPPVTLDGVLKFWVMDDGQYHEHYDVYVSTTSNNIEDFTLLYEPGNASSTWTEVTVDLSRLGGVTGYIALRNIDYDQDYLLIDDFGIGTVNQAGPWQPVVSNVTSPYTLNGLAPETNYEWQVQGNCASGTTDWSISDYFKTASACDTPVNLLASNITAYSAVLSWSDYQSDYNVQYRTAANRETYYFNDFNETESEGWTWNPFWIYGFEDPIYNIPGNENYFIQMGWNSTEEETIISCELPTYESGSIVEFYYFGYSVENTFQVGFSSTTTDTDAFTWSNRINAPLQEYTLYQEVLPAGTKYVAFKATAASQSACIFIDDFGIFGPTTPAGAWQPVSSVTNPYTLGGLLPDTEYEWQVQGICSSGNTDWSEIASFVTLPSCIVPTNLAVSNVTADGADLKWTSDATSFEIELNDGSNVVVIDGVTETRYMLLDLEPATIYNVRVRANCGGGDYSQWTNPVAFVTDCGGAKDLPYSYGFEDIGEYYACWYAESYNDENEVSIYWEDEEHTNRVFAFSSFYDADDYTQVLISPELNATTPVSFQFDYKVSSQYAYESVLVGYITDEMDNFEWLYDIYETNNYDEWETFSGIFPAGTKYVALYYFSEFQYYLFLDNFRFDIPKTFVTDGDWDEANNWLPVGVPTILDNVAIEAEATIPADCVAEVNAILIEEGGSITIEDGGLLYHSTDELEVTVKKNVPAYTGDNDYKLISFPFYGTTVPQDMTTPDGYDLYRFDNSQPGEEWQNNKILENEDIYMDEGYLYANPEGVELTMTGNTKPSNVYSGSDLNYEYIYLSYDDTENEVNGWYLLGNPFLVDAYIYSVIFGEDENGDYTIEDIIPMNAMYYDENGDMQTIEGGPIAPMQGFFVSVTEDVEAYIFPFDFLNAKNKPSLKSLKKRNGNNNTIPAVKLPNIAVSQSVNTMPATMTVKPMPVKTKAVKSEPAKTMSVKSVKAAPANTVSKKTMSITPMLDKKLSIKK